ncbi:uncharacterized protein [Coffea arabica]|uniref:RNase H type-1 domain-containing protein n=1 Tax=Coffea arabica TaxID=13443 RepID=A0ABM4VYP3_COFAR
MDFWHDNWMGTGAICHQVENFQDRVLSDFVFQAQWNMRLLNQVLEPELVRQVVKIPPSSTHSSDRMMWALTQNGSFSVSSAYTLVSQASNYSWVVSHVWLKGFPIKISFFMLRLLRLHLPLMDLLHRFGVQGPSKCHCCSKPADDEVNHIFLTGDLAKVVRNRFEGVLGYLDMVSTLRHVLLRCGSFEKNGFYLPITWSAPRAGYKLNLDGCAKGNPGVSGGGRVVRDGEGRFIVGYSCFFGSLTSLHAELKATLFGVLLFVARGLQDFHVESDSLVLVQILQGTHGCPWRLQREVDELLSFKHHFREITHCYREVNKPADYLANLGTNSEQEDVFDNFRSLLATVRREIIMDTLGFPDFRRKLL